MCEPCHIPKDFSRRNRSPQPSFQAEVPEPSRGERLHPFQRLLLQAFDLADKVASPLGRARSWRGRKTRALGRDAGQSRPCPRGNRRIWRRWGRRARKITVGPQAHVLRRSRKQMVGKKPYRKHHDEAYCCCSDRKSQRANRFYPERREDHAADTPAVVRHRESGGAGADEPGRDDRVECKRAHPTPARAAEHARHRELPGRRRAGPTEDASGQAKCASLRHCRSAKAPVKLRQIGPDDRADQEVDGDGRRDNGERPALSFAQFRNTGGP